MYRFFNNQSKTISSAAFIIALMTLISKSLGILRDRVLASQFGAGDVLDMYFAAFRIPDLVYNLLVLGALSAGFIPIFTSVFKKDNQKVFFKDNQNKEAWQLVNNILNFLSISLIIICVILILLSPSLIPLISPGFSEEKQKITVILTQIMFLSPIFLGISAVLGGILQSVKNFFIYSLAPIMYNLGIIIGALLLVPLWGIYGLALGVVLGAGFHLLIQLPSIYLLGYRWRLYLKTSDKRVQLIGKMMIPRISGLALGQINLIIMTTIATTLAIGSVSVFNLANNLQAFPLSLFAISYAMAAFPVLSEKADQKDLSQFKNNLSITVRQILFFMIPASIFLLVLRAQITRVVYGAGQFDWEDTVLTLNTVGFFSLSLFAQGLIPLLVRAFYALKNSFIPFITGFFSTLVNIILALWLSQRYEVAGLALAFSLSSLVNVVLLWISLRIKIGSLDDKNIVYSVIKISLAALSGGIVVQGIKYIIEPFTGTTTFLAVFFQGLIAGLVGIIFYLLVLWLFKSEELMFFFKSFRRHFIKEAQPIEEVVSEEMR